MSRTACGLVFGLLLLSLGAIDAAAWQQFRRPAYYGTGSNTSAYQVVSAQFTNSGNADLAVADYPASAVSILLGNGDGTFQKAKKLLVPNPVALAVGDFNGDGKADLAVVEYGGTGESQVSVYLGNGNGQFRKSVGYPSGVETTSVAVADFNGDGRQDLVVANNSGNIMVFFGTGKGTFKKPIKYNIGNTPWAVVAGNLNRDNRSDLVVTNIDGYVSVLLNDGTGKFLKPVTYSAGGGAIQDVKIGDLRHDGRNDLVVANASLSAVGVLLNTGDGTFAAVKLYPTSLPGESTGADGVVIADFNMDGVLDLAASNQDGNSALFYGKGDGTFKPAVAIHDEIKFDGAIGLTVGDFNNDQAPDLAFAMYFKPKVAVMINTK